MKEKKKVLSLFYGIAGLALPIILFFLISIVLNIGLLNLLGFEYTSISIVVIFFILYTLMAFFMETFVQIYILAVTELGRMNKLASEILSFIFLVCSDIVIVSLLETLVEGITIPNRTIILFSIITYIGGKILDEFLYNSSSETVEGKNGKKVKKFFGKKKRNSEE